MSETFQPPSGVSFVLVQLDGKLESGVQQSCFRLHGSFG